MTKHRHALPQLSGKPFLTDSGLETTMVFHEGFDMPLFEAFKFLDDAKGRAWMEGYYRDHIAIAKHNGYGFVLESPTWRANIDWGTKLGFTKEQLVHFNRAAIELMLKLRDELASEEMPIVVSGCIGPLGDGYKPEGKLTIADAEEAHAMQVNTFAAAGVDMISAITMTTVEESVGILHAASKAGLPCVISFTVETDGRLPTGETLAEAIKAVDAATDSPPAYYMINCAHPTHFAQVLETGEPWTKRIMGLRANASKRSHAELDESSELDTGNPHELGEEYAELVRALPSLKVLGGCCGTDHRHVEAIAEACRRTA